jgi:hypothetical protein
VGNPVPDDAVPLCSTARTCGPRSSPEEPEGVVIDFKAGLAEFTK